MIKKLVVASAILAASSTMALASGAPYLGASLGVVNNTANSGGSFRGVPLTISAGYGAAVDQSLYLAGEIFGTVATSSLDNVSIGQSLRSTYGYGISFIPGIIISDHTMTYARIGVVKTRFNSIGDNATGGQLGLGLQTSLTQNWDLRGEYDYTKYRRINGISPKSDAFNIGLIYKFE